MPVLLGCEDEHKARVENVFERKNDSRFSNNDTLGIRQPSDVLPNQEALPNSDNAKTSWNHATTKAINKKKFYFPPFNVKHHTQIQPNAPKQFSSIFAEKIKNHCEVDPHHDHKHYHNHEYHHQCNNNEKNCKDNSCTGHDENFEFELDGVKEVQTIVKTHDSVIIHAASLHITKIRVQNMCCPKEGRMVQEELGKLPGINTIRVDIFCRMAYISHDQDKVTPTEILAALNKRDFGASLIDAATEVNHDFPRQLKILFVFLVVQVFFFGIALAAVLFHASWYLWVAIVQICFGMLPLLKKCCHSIYQLQIDFNVLITVTVIGTLGIRQWIEGGILVFTFILANFLQEFCFYSVHKIISSLMLTKASKAVMACTGELVPSEDVSIGSIIAVRQGEFIPLDGVVVKGSASVDESSISGKTEPVEKTLTSQVYSGSAIKRGYLELETTSLATSSTVLKIASLVKNAQLNASPTEMMNKFTSYYTPLVVLLAAITFLIRLILHLSRVRGGSILTWSEPALIVLVTACPCALLMASPVVIISGINAGARLGVLIKGATFLEALSQIEFLAFDKTGTLTEGIFQVVDLILANKDKENDIMRWAAALASKSSHPLAAAIVTEFREKYTDCFANDMDGIQLPDVSNFRIMEGRGICGVVENHFVDIGNLEILAYSGVKLTPEFETEYHRFKSENKTIVFICVDQELAIMISLADSVREDSHVAVRWLQDLGVYLVMLTGDSKETATSVQKELKLNAYVSEMKPEDKLKWIKNIKEEHTLRKRRCCKGENIPLVGMVGDGVNDGPALGAADVGIAMAERGSALAVEAAGMVIMTNSILKVPEIICLSRFCRRLIIENIVLAIVLKLVFVVIVVGVIGYVQVWMAVVADLAGLLVVILNGLRPLIWKPSSLNAKKNVTPKASWLQRKQRDEYKRINQDDET